MRSILVRNTCDSEPLNGIIRDGCDKIREKRKECPQVAEYVSRIQHGLD